jgi:hypothetical protein
LFCVTKNTGLSSIVERRKLSRHTLEGCRMSAIERPDAARKRLGVKTTHFSENFVLRNEDDPFLPGTTIPRLRPVPLGIRAIGFLSDEIDALIKALRQLRDSGAAPPRISPRSATAPPGRPVPRLRSRKAI